MLPVIQKAVNRFRLVDCYYNDKLKKTIKKTDLQQAKGIKLKMKFKEGTACGILKALIFVLNDS